MKRRVRYRHENLATDLGRGPVRDNRTRHPARVALRAAALSLWAAGTAACSLSIPISGVTSDDLSTGSVDRTAAMLSPSLDREDVRRARAAMAVALDPQGNGARAGWQNPQTGAHGAFTAAATPFTDHDRVCRRFAGEVVPAAGPERRLSGSACRVSDGSWQVMAEPGSKA